MTMTWVAFDAGSAERQCRARDLSLVALLLTMTTCTPTLVGDVPPERPNAIETPRAPQQGTNSARAIDNVVFVAIDGVRWQEVFHGVDRAMADARSRRRFSTPDALMPELHRIARTRGFLLGGDDARVTVSSPSTVSLPGYAELFEGRTPTCANNDCVPTSRSTLLDDWQHIYPDDCLAVISSWDRIPLVAARQTSNLVISAGRQDWRNFNGALADPQVHRLWEAGRLANPSPGVDLYRPDRYTAELALDVLRRRSPEFLFLGLGDTDEYAHQGDHGAYLESLHHADNVVGQIDAWLAQRQGLGKRTLLVVTTDHGRSRGFRHHGGAKEAARIWLSWSGSVVRTRGYPAAADSRLADVVPAIEPLLGGVHSNRQARDNTWAALPTAGVDLDESHHLVFP